MARTLTQTAPTFVGVGAQDASAVSGHLNVAAFPGGIQAGDFALLVVAGRPSDAVDPVTPAGWTKRSSVLLEVGTADLKLITYWRFLDLTEAAPQIAVPSSWSTDVGAGLCGMSVQVIVFRNVEPGVGFDNVDVTGTSAAAATWVAPAMDSLTPQALGVTIVATADDNELGLLAGSENAYTLRAGGAAYNTSLGSDHAVGIATKVKPAAGTITVPTWQETVNGNDAWVGITCVLRGAAAERAVLASSHINVYSKLEVLDSDGAWRDLTALSGYDWLDRWTIGESIDDPVARATFVLRREVGGFSLAPLVQSSALNRNGAGAYVPLLSAPRLMRFSTATVANGVTPVGGDWHQIFKGPITSVDAAEPEDGITVIAFDMGQLLQLVMIETENQYGSLAGTAIETVLQNIIDAWVTSTPPVVTPVSPGVLISKYTQDRVNVLEALRALALVIGWDIRYLYQAGTDTPELRFYQPPRSKVIPDWAFAGTEYERIQLARLADEDVRNVCKVNYVDIAGVQQSVSRQNGGSIAVYGRRYMEISNDSTSAIDTAAEANAMGDAAVADLGTPLHEHEIQTFFFWPLQLNDLCRFVSNAVHYDQDQDLAAVAFRHEGAGGHATTTISARGKPAGAYSDWIRRSRIGGPSTGGEATVEAPYAHIMQMGQGTIAQVQLAFVGAPLDPTMYPILWTIKDGDADWTAPVSQSTVLDYRPWINRAIGYDKVVHLKVTQADGQFSFYTYSVPSHPPDDISHGPREDTTRGGGGGVPTTGKNYDTQPKYDPPGAVPLIDPATKSILSGLAIGPGVRGDSTVAFGATTKYPTMRHAEDLGGISAGGPYAFGVSYENIPNISVRGDLWTLPGLSSTVDRQIEMRAINVGVSTADIRAVSVTGATLAAKTENPAATLNGAPNGAGIDLTLANDDAFFDLSNANATLTTYNVKYNVDTSAMIGSGFLRVRIYKNNGVASTSWTLVGTRTYDVGSVLTNEVMSFDAAMTLDWDILVLVDYTGGASGATVHVVQCYYNKITAGTETTLTPAGSTLTLQAREAA